MSNLKDKPYFCVLPWMHIHVNTQGRLVPCCMAKNENQYPHIDEGEFPVLFSYEKFKNLRRDMLSDTPNSDCQQCYELEKYGTHSGRNHANSKYLSEDVVSAILNSTNEDGSLETVNILYWDVRFNNICNYKCRMCGVNYSTKWYEDANLLGWIEKPKKPIVSINNVTEFCNKNKEYIKQMKYVYFAGGEPLVQDEHYEFLRWCIDNNIKPELYYQSNGSILDYKKNDILNLWKHFSKVTYSVSIDSFGKLGEYIRSGYKDSTVQENLEKICKEFGSNREITINSTFMAYNAFYITEFFDEISTKSWVMETNVYPQLLVHPEHLQPKVLPDDIKKIALEKIYKSVWYEKYPHKFLSLINNLKEDFSPDLWDKFKAYTKKLDDGRDESILEVFPELGPYYD